MKHIKTREEFLNEKFGDGIKNVAKKIGNKIKSLFAPMLNVAKNIYVFFANGNIVNSNAGISSIQKGSTIPGIYVLSSDGAIDTTAGFVNNDEVYSMDVELSPAEQKTVDKYLSLDESLENPLNEAGLYAEDGGFGVDEVTNIKTSEAYEIVELMLYANIAAAQEILETNPNAIVDMKYQAPCFWGAPGVGKTTICKNIIKEFNKNAAPNEKKGLIVIDCSQIDRDSLSLPVVNQTTTLANLADTSNFISAKAKELMGKSSAERQNELKELMQNIQLKRIDDAPKTWFPCYDPSAAQGDPEIIKLMDDIANCTTTAIESSTGGNVGYELTTNGGFILIDEFLRNPDLQSVLMPIMLEHKIGQYTLGSKWQLIACSNRPTDSAQVKHAFSQNETALLNRVSHYNLVPSYAEWREWAVKQPYFLGENDPIIEAMGEEHNGTEMLFDYGKKPVQTEGGETRYSVNYNSPRSITETVRSLAGVAKGKNLKNYLELPERLIELMIAGKYDVASTKKIMAKVKQAKKEYADKSSGKVRLKPADIATIENLQIPDGISSTFSVVDYEKTISDIQKWYLSNMKKEEYTLKDWKTLVTNIDALITKAAKELNVDPSKFAVMTSSFLHTVVSKYLVKSGELKRGQTIVWNPALGFPTDPNDPAWSEIKGPNGLSCGIPLTEKLKFDFLFNEPKK